MWHEETGPAERPTPKCCRCGDSKRIWSVRLGDWMDCPDCQGDEERRGGVVTPTVRVRIAD
jgi:hypothetical protein